MLNKLQFQNLAELQLQNLDQPLCSKSEKSLVLGPNVSSQICNKLLPTWSSLSTSATVTTSTSFELASSHARVTSIKFTKQEWVSQSVQTWNLSKKLHRRIFRLKILHRQFHLISTVLVRKNTKNEWKWRNLHRWQKFYTAAGTDGMDKFHLCPPQPHPLFDPTVGIIWHLKPSTIRMKASHNLWNHHN